MVKHTETIRRLSSTNCFSMFDHFVGLVLKGLIKGISKLVAQKSTFLLNFSLKFFENVSEG